MGAPVRKAVFPVGGLGTRFLPATKAMPKEMLTVVDRPLIQHVVDEARAAGIEHFIFVTGRNKTAIEDHFDKQVELERSLTARGKLTELGALGADQLGPGRHELHPAANAARPRSRGLVRARYRRPRAFRAATSRCADQGEWQKLPRPDAGRLREAWRQYCRGRGRARRRGRELRRGQRQGRGGGGNVFPINGMVEKPRPARRPPTLRSSAAIFCSRRFSTCCRRRSMAKAARSRLTDAMLKLLERQKFHAVKHEGKSFDCGSKLGFLLANVTYALDRPELSEALTEELKKLVK